MELFSQIDQFTKAHEAKKTEEQLVKQSVADYEERLAAIPPKVELLEKVRIFLQTLAEATRDEIMAGLEDITTRCIQSIFGPHYRFEIEVETKRNNTGLEFYVIDESVSPPLRITPDDNLGGGMIDTIAIGLRFGLLKVVHPMPEGPIFLDEPAKMVSGDLILQIGLLLKELSEIFDRQILLSTHHQVLMDNLDNSIFVKRENGISIVRKG